MAVSLTPKFSAAQIKQYVQQASRQLDAEVLLGLQKVGEKFITNARLKGSYKDHSQNLRHSSGYVILKNGVQIGGFVQPLAAAAINEAKRKHPKGYVLIGVAGMIYAAAVEKRGKKDVISASVILAGSDLAAMMQQIQKKLST